MVDTDIIKYLIQKLEEKIRINPFSPDFAKLANYYLVIGNNKEAIELLQAGLKIYPQYTTAKLLLGKAFLSSRYYVNAKQVFDKLLEENPFIAIARKYLDIINDLTKSEVSRSYDDDIIPKLDFKAPAFNESDFNFNMFPDYEIEDLISDKIDLNDIEEKNEYLDFKKIYQTPYYFKKEGNSKKTLEKKRLKNKFELKIVTETLADIFAKQGNYFDAIEAYTYLLKVKPERKEVLESKINEVEIQINKLINDF